MMQCAHIPWDIVVFVFDVLIAMLDVLTLAGTYLQIGVNCTFKNMANCVIVI